jgi:Uma2 family endonuclease
MEQPRQARFTADEFIAWAMEQPTGRFELDKGVVVAMAPEGADHATAKGNVFIALRNALGADGLPCQAFPDGMSVRIDERTIYEPDALVRCGPPLSGDAIEANDPLILVEVVSSSSRGIDRSVKLTGYFSLPTDKKVMIHHHRHEEGRIEVRIFNEGPLALDPPGLSIEVRDIFVGV